MKNKVLCGADRVVRDGYVFNGKCGLITNHTGVLKDLTSTVDVLKEKFDIYYQNKKKYKF